MVAFIRLLIYILIAGFIVAFSVANPDPVTVAWSPLHNDATLPAYALALGGLAVGFILGGLMVWVNSFSFYIENRRKNREIKNLRRELDDEHRKLAAQENSLPAAPAPPTHPVSSL